ncbi:MAG TPA: DUF1080 domain-containing protein [Verrucomicrobiae bacterium]|jgi:hypothetical protein|nr:DUF1080 domain-containing protein [Verrucomicrobiae bacterium]
MNSPDQHSLTRCLFASAVLTVSCAAPHSACAADDWLQPGFTSICDGQTLDGWWGASTEDPRGWMSLAPDKLKRKHDDSLADIRQHWRVENGELVNDGSGLYLTTDKNYGDIELDVDYKTVPLADSGIYLKGCPQVQIWDHTNAKEFKNGAQKGSGGLWNNSPGAPGKDPLVLADKPFGEWNHFHVRQLGSRTTVVFNDQLVVDNAILENYFNRQLPIPPTGPIQLQTHGGEIRWRHLALREIPIEESNRLLRGKDPEGFEPIFNGVNMDGWEGPVDCCKVEDGAIVWQHNKGGTPYYKDIYTNFIVRLEFKLPPGGNNGLAIRYPGEGDTAYVGMCECQVLDDNYEKATGDKIDPRQAHGSAYGMVAAARGYQRPIGAWNYEEVTVIGSKMKVELNGFIILDCDLSTVHEFMHNSAHPGKDRTFGHFGLAGHNDPVAFRNISVKRLD